MEIYVNMAPLLWR